MTKLLACWLVGCLAVGTFAGCGSKDDPLSFLTHHAVGTYIGGGSMLTGPSACTYQGTDGVFVDQEGKPSATAAVGPRFVMAAGTITKDCSGTKTTIKALVPTSAKISGPTTVTKGSDGALYSAVLVASGKELGGEASIEWKLGTDCAGVADFGPVLGSQDTGGRARNRSLVTSKPGTCTLTVSLTNESSLYPAYKSQTLSSTLALTIK